MIMIIQSEATTTSTSEYKIRFNYFSYELLSYVQCTMYKTTYYYYYIPTITITVTMMISYFYASKFYYHFIKQTMNTGTRQEAGVGGVTVLSVFFFFLATVIFVLITVLKTVNSKQ